MRYRTVEHGNFPKACREHWGNQSCGETISDTIHLVRSKVRQRREASADSWLSLAAAPTFALMTLLTSVDDGQMMCAPAQHASPLSGMAAMYLLMCAFHSAPWLRLCSGGPKRRRPS